GSEEFRTGIRETNPTWKVDGDWPPDRGATSNQAVALVGKSLAQRIGLRPGATLVFDGGSQVKISGILNTGGAEEDQVFVPMAFAQQLAGQPGRLRRLQVSALTQPEDAFARRDPKTLSPADLERW